MSTQLDHPPEEVSDKDPILLHLIEKQPDSKDMSAGEGTYLGATGTNNNTDSIGDFD